MAGVPEVCTYVTAPLLPVSESWSAKEVDVGGVAVALVGELWVIMPAGPTRRLKKNVPWSPLASLIVPRTTYEPGGCVPLVVIRPVGETITAGAPEVCAYVTAPLLPVTESWSVKVADVTGVAVADVGGFCVIVPTLRLKKNVPWSPLESLIVPRTTYEPGGSVPLVVIRPVGETIMAGVPEICAYVTAPLLPVTESWSVKVTAVATDADADVGGFCVMVPTARLKANVPLSPFALVVPVAV
jgi:hypothetical protein